MVMAELVLPVETVAMQARSATAVTAAQVSPVRQELLAQLEQAQPLAAQVETAAMAQSAEPVETAAH